MYSVITFNGGDTMTDAEQKKIFAKNLNRYINLSGKQQKEIAKDLGYSPTTFNTWCVGKIIPNTGKIQRIADYFNIGKSDLLDDTSSSITNSNNLLNKLDLDTIQNLNENNISKLNKYAQNLLAIQQMEDEPVLMAAHHDNPTEEQQLKINKDMDILKRPT